MANLADRFSITITRNSPSISRTGFGTPLIAGYVSTSVIPERVRLYSGTTGLSDMITDGFTANDPIYMCTAQLLAQTPRPKQFKIGRLAGASFTYNVQLEPTTFATGNQLKVTMRKGTATASWTRNCGGVSLAAECTALAALLNDATGWGSGGTAELTISGASGTRVDIDAISPANDNEMWFIEGLENLNFTDNRADRGMATELTAIEAYDSDWYGLVLADSFNEIEIEAVAAWVETREKIFVAQTQDYDVPAGTGPGHDLHALSRDRTMVIYSHEGMNEYPAAAAVGKWLPQTPGEVSWSDKSLSGVTPTVLTAAQITNLQADGVCHYTTTAGVGNFFPGTVVSGEYMDIIILTDYTVARVRENVFSALRAADKIPFTDDGVSMIEGIVRNVLQSKMPNGFVTGTDFFSAPLVADVDAADKAARRLPDVTFGATFAGAILYVTFTATLAF